MSKWKDLFLYGIVGGIATGTEWVIFFLLNDTLHWHYMLATILAYVLSTFVNWAAGRVLVFKEASKGFVKEIVSIYLASVIGLLLNLAIMWVMVEWIGVMEMISKITATVLVFAWNYIIRKKVIYRREN